MPVPIQTPRLILRAITHDDLDALVELDSDPAVMRYLTDGVPTPREKYLGEDGFLAQMMSIEETPWGFWSAQTEGRFIGWFHLRPSVADPDVLEVGYRLRQDAWGRGLATEGSRALAELNFGPLGREEMHAVTLEENRASARVMQKLGMTFRGRLIHPRGGMEVVWYACDAQQFLESEQR